MGRARAIHHGGVAVCLLFRVFHRERHVTWRETLVDHGLLAQNLTVGRVHLQKRLRGQLKWR